MAFLESGVFCTAEEYQRGLSHRVDEGQLQVDDIYTMFLLLDSVEREATKLAVRPREILKKEGLIIVRFAFLDKELNIQHEGKEVMQDGLITNVRETIVVDNERSKKYGAAQAYLKDYFDEQFGHLLSESDCVSAVG